MTPTIRSSRTPPIAWWMLAVLGLVFALFAGDRAVLGVLKTTLGTELHMSNADYSVLVTSFMVPYTVMYLFVGGWTDRVGVKRTLTVCVTLMSAATVISGTAHGVFQLAAGRFVLGLAEAGVVPGITLAIFTWFASDRRAVAYSLANTVQQGAYILSPPFVAIVTLHVGWRWSFLIPGLSGFVVALLWWRTNAIAGPPPPVEAVAAGEGSSTRSPIWTLLRSPSVRMLILARVISDPFWFFFLYWQNAFLQERVGLSLARIGQVAWIPPAVYVVTALGLSSFSDRLIARGWTAPKARLLLIATATAFAPAAFLLPFARSEAAAITLVSLVGIMCNTWLNMSSVFMGALVPRHSLASAIGLMSALGGFTSIAFNAVIGSIIDRFGYDAPFWVGACLHPIAALLLIRHFTRQNHRATTVLEPGCLSSP